MPSITSPFRLAARVVAHQVQRLHAILDELAAQVRAAIARAVGQVTGEAVREALGVILDGPRAATRLRLPFRAGGPLGPAPPHLLAQPVLRPLQPGTGRRLRRGSEPPLRGGRGKRTHRWHRGITPEQCLVAGAGSRLPGCQLVAAQAPGPAGADGGRGHRHRCRCCQPRGRALRHGLVGCGRFGPGTAGPGRCRSLGHGVGVRCGEVTREVTHRPCHPMFLARSASAREPHSPSPLGSWVA